MESEAEVCLEGRRGIAGDWQGTIGEQKRRVVVRIATADEGGWKATFHPIDQTAQPIPIDSVCLEGHSFKLTINAIQGGYEGTISADRELCSLTKQELARRKWDSIDDYANAKTQLIEEIIARAIR
jgi:hypothetical protein